MDRRRRNHARRHHRGKLLPKVEVPLIHHELVVIIMNMKVMTYDSIQVGEERPVTALNTIPPSESIVSMVVSVLGPGLSLVLLCL